jgi:hypothetical protein
MSYKALKNIKQQIGVPSVRFRFKSNNHRKKTLHFYLITAGRDFWTGDNFSDYTDAVIYTDESEAVEVACGLKDSKVIYNYGYPSENVVFEY